MRMMDDQDINDVKVSEPTFADHAISVRSLAPSIADQNSQRSDSSVSKVTTMNDVALLVKQDVKIKHT